MQTACGIVYLGLQDKSSVQMGHRGIMEKTGGQTLVFGSRRKLFQLKGEVCVGCSSSFDFCV